MMKAIEYCVEGRCNRLKKESIKKKKINTSKETIIDAEDKTLPVVVMKKEEIDNTLDTTK